jgi:hypothetical protein
VSTTLAAELFVKIHKSLAFEGVTWVPRTEETPVGVESEKGRALMRGVNRHEFDLALKRKIDATPPGHLFILSNFYDVGFWRRSSEHIKPDVVWYVESVTPTEDPRHASFVRFVRGLELKDVRFVKNDEMTVLKMLPGALDLAHMPDVASV